MGCARPAHPAVKLHQSFHENIQVWDSVGGSRGRLILVLGLTCYLQFTLFLLTLSEGTGANTNRMIFLARLKRLPKLCVINYF